MTTPLPVGPLTPYCSPEQLIQAPTGVDFFSIPPGTPLTGVTPQANTAEISNICQRATDLVDQTCCQPLRATVDTLPLYGPGVRVGVPANGAPAELILKRWPVLEVISIQVAPNRLPWVFTSVPSTAFQVKYPVVGLYGSSAPAAAAEGGQTVLLDPYWLAGNGLNGGGRGWGPGWGHNQFVIMTQYVNGWPHCGLTSAATAGATTLAVDDCTGWTITAPFAGAPTGATGTAYDAGNQEVIHVTSASAASGPGTLTLASPLQSAHAPGVIVSSLPQAVTWAAMLFACEIALERGATAMTMMEVPGREVAQKAGVDTSYGSPACWAEKILAPFARII